MAFKDETAFAHWCMQKGYTARTITLIQRVRNSPPSRTVKGGRGNVHARVPSQKMGVVIQSESRTAEKPGMRVFYEYDYMVEDSVDAPVIEYYDQPEKIVLKYVSASGRKVTTWHTPDFFVIRETGAAWEEWKTEQELVKLAEKQPGRYQKGLDGVWRCPPGEVYAAQWGLRYRLRSNAEINWNLFSNLEFLHDYLATKTQPPGSTNEALITQVTQNPGMSLDVLLETSSLCADDLYRLIANRQLYVDLCAARLVQPDKVQIYTSRAAAEAHHNLQQHQQDIHWQDISLQPGTSLEWDGQQWILVNLGRQNVALHHAGSGRFQDIPRKEFETALAAGKITSIGQSEENDSIHLDIYAAWTRATEADYAIANARLHVLEEVGRGISLTEIWSASDVKTILGKQKTLRTIRTWRRQFTEADQLHGNGYIGLLPKIYKRGNRERKLSETALEKMQAFIETRYEDLRQSRVSSVWVEYYQDCEREGISPASLKTFSMAIKSRPLDIQHRKRQGRRSAHQVQKRYWHLEATTPKHGERAWHIVHLDHTRLDIELRHSKTGKNLGRPWATFAVDAYSRRLLAVVLSLDDNPSYRHCMMVLREMVRRFHRLPQIIYVDNGKEFKSTYFQTLLAYYAVEVAYRPPGQPRFGDVVERLFRTTNSQFLYNLTGNTQISKEVRLMTKSNDPRNLAVWSLDWLYLALREWAYEVYDRSEHTSLHQSPREAFEDSLRLHGSRSFKRIDYDTFILNALPTPRWSKFRKVQPSGVKINNIYYWHDWMYRPDIMETQVPVRYDPFNVGIAYAYLDKEWVRCTSEYFVIFNNRTEQELQIAREELSASFRRYGRVTRTLNAKLLADFLLQTTASECLLKQQERDDAMHFVRSSITDNLTDETLQIRLSASSENESELPSETLSDSSSISPTHKTVSYEHLTLPDDF